MTTRTLKSKMSKIEKLYNQIDTILNTIPNGLKDEINDFHVDDKGLLYCTIWGQQAAENLKDDAKLIIMKANENGAND